MLQEVPKLPKINDLSDLTDGVAVTSIMSLYCPDDMPWSNLALGMYVGLGFTKNVTLTIFWSLAFYAKIQQLRNQHARQV